MDRGGLPERIGPYRLEEPLGAGGMGSVWRAWDERLKRRVAVKRLRTDRTVPDGLERLLREARTAAGLNHSAIVQIHDLLEDATGNWIVMELVEGRTLRRLVEEQGPLPVAEALRIGREIAEGLAEAHDHQILHRDLKTSNVMVGLSGRIKILDFGLAKRLPHNGEEAEAEAPLSSAGMVLGTCHTMSPEQALGQDLDARSDLFSLGSLLYEILTGEPPFRAATPTSSLARVLSFHPPELQDARPDVPRELSKLVARLLEKERLYRPRSAREVAEALAGMTDASFAGEIEGTTILDSPPETPGERQRTIGEHRLLTVVCCGLVGLDEPGEAGFLDPESLTEAMTGLEGLARTVCESFSGASETLLGHRLWLYFGYPQAREDDALRAVQAARELADRVSEIGPVFSPDGTRQPALRTAVHTGFAIVSIRPGQGEQLQPGPLLETARALQDLARAGEVVVSEATRTLIARAFATKTLSSARVPGLEEPVALYRVTGELDPRDGESGPLTPLVGRDGEVELLLDRYRLARAGSGQAVLVSGEPGIGKSSLVKALRERLAAEPPAWQIAHGSTTDQSSPLAPFLHLIPESVPLVTPEARERRQPGRVSADAQRRRTFDALIARIAEMAESGPLVLVFEDLHWVDPSTLELLGLLLNEIPALPLLLVATFRPELHLPWPHRPHITHLSLGRLDEAEATVLIDRVAQGRELPADARRQLLARAEGVPLFVEELTRALLETGLQGGIPTTLGGSLAARLDRSGPAKEVAQVASVLGRTFTFELLAAVAPQGEKTLQEGLAELIRAELIQRRGMGKQARYSFKHSLLQGIAYASLLSRDRQELHRKTAEALEAETNEPGLLAHHWSNAIDARRPQPDLVRKALPHLLQAGEHTLQLGANPEARAHLELALELLRTLPEESKRDEQELSLLALLFRALEASHGVSSPEARRTSERIHKLRRQRSTLPSASS
ncbi:MAG: protein kinase [Acidobacteriota bacterium]